MLSHKVLVNRVQCVLHGELGQILQTLSKNLGQDLTSQFISQSHISLSASPSDWWRMTQGASQQGPVCTAWGTWSDPSDPQRWPCPGPRCPLPTGDSASPRPHLTVTQQVFEHRPTSTRLINNINNIYHWVCLPTYLSI